MHRMLNPNPKERITVPEIMAHPWFCTDLPAGVSELNETLLATAAAAEVDAYDASCSAASLVGNLATVPKLCCILRVLAVRCCCGTLFLEVCHTVGILTGSATVVC